MASKADEFRKQAEESQQRAERAANSFDKKHWLEVAAAHCRKMAAAEEAATGTLKMRPTTTSFSSTS